MNNVCGCVFDEMFGQQSMYGQLAVLRHLYGVEDTHSFHRTPMNHVCTP